MPGRRGWWPSARYGAQDRAGASRGPLEPLLEGLLAIQLGRGMRTSRTSSPAGAGHLRRSSACNGLGQRGPYRLVSRRPLEGSPAGPKILVTRLARGLLWRLEHGRAVQVPWVMFPYALQPECCWSVLPRCAALGGRLWTG